MPLNDTNEGNTSLPKEDPPQTTTWQQTAAAKRAALTALLPAEWHIPSTSPIPTAAELPNATLLPRKYLTEREIEITECRTASELLGKLAKREYSAVEVTEAFCHRAVIAHQLVRSVHFPFVPFVPLNIWGRGLR